MPAEIEFIGHSVLGLPLDPRERVKTACTLAVAVLTEAAIAVDGDAEPGLLRTVSYALGLARRAAIRAEEVSRG